MSWPSALNWMMEMALCIFKLTSTSYWFSSLEPFNLKQVHGIILVGI